MAVQEAALKVNILNNISLEHEKVSEKWLHVKMGYILRSVPARIAFP